MSLGDTGSRYSGMRGGLAQTKRPALQYGIDDPLEKAGDSLRGASTTTASMTKDISGPEAEKTVGGAITAGVGGLASGIAVSGTGAAIGAAYSGTIAAGTSGVAAGGLGPALAAVGPVGWVVGAGMLAAYMFT